MSCMLGERNLGEARILKLSQNFHVCSILCDRNAEQFIRDTDVSSSNVAGTTFKRKTLDPYLTSHIAISLQCATGWKILRRQLNDESLLPWIRYGLLRCDDKSRMRGREVAWWVRSQWAQLRGSLVLGFDLGTWTLRGSVDDSSAVVLPPTWETGFPPCCRDVRTELADANTPSVNWNIHYLLICLSDEWMNKRTLCNYKIKEK